MKMDWLKSELEEIKKNGLYRHLNTIRSSQTPVIIKDGRELINLSSNNYLGMANHPKVIKAMMDAAFEYGTGAGASRLAGANTDMHNSLDEKIALFKNTESAIVFSTGYMANIGTIAAIMNKGDLIMSDELNHASIIDGCRLSRADVQVYPHMDINSLEKKMRESCHKKKLVVTDGVFSMDGDIAPLPEIVEIARKYDAMVMVDDAHAMGVLGKHWRGTADHFNVEVDINMGTLSKALGSIGGFVAGSEELIEILRNRARPFIYSTALPPPDAAAAKTAIDIIGHEKPAEKLWKNIKIYRNGLKNIGFPIISETQIIPIMTGDPARTQAVASLLEKLGVYAHGIRPPTVPEGKGRIRTSIMASHSKKDISEAIEAFSALKEKFNLQVLCQGYS